MTNILAKIRSRGNWQVTIRPFAYKPGRVNDISLLFPLIEKLTVRIRGWDSPHVDYRSRPHIDLNWVGQEYDWEHHKAIWRFYQSGQFLHIFSIPLDWRDESTIWPADNAWKAGQLLGVGDVIITLTEITLLASRLALSPAGDDPMTIEVDINGIQGRTLYVDSHRARWPFMQSYTASIETYPIRVILPSQELVARSPDLALEFAQGLFQRFGWDTSIDLLRDWQTMMG